MRTGDTQLMPTSVALVTVTIGVDTYTTNDESPANGGRIVSVTADEQVWGGQYTILLDNSDETLNAKDYQGSLLDLNFGFIGGATNDSLPPLYILSHAFISKAGKLLLQLNCIDAWGLISQLSTNLVSAAFNQEWQQASELAGRSLPSDQPLPASLITAISAQYGLTIYDIITQLVDMVDLTIVKDAGDDDGRIDTLMPPINLSDPISGIRQLLEMTNCYLLWRKESGVGKFRVIQPSAHASVYTYNTGSLFFSNLHDVEVTIPNQITFWAIDPTGADWVSGTANDTASQTKLGVIIPRHYMLANLDIDTRASVADLEDMADGALAKLQGERSQGILIAPMHCTQELFDKITIVDDRYTAASKTTTGYVHRIIREYDRGVYRITIQLGGVTSSYTPPGGNIPVPLASADPPSAGPASVQSTTDPALLPIHSTVVFTSVDQDDISWSAGILYFSNGTTQAIAIDVISTYHLADTDKVYFYCDLDDAHPEDLKSTKTFSVAVDYHHIWIAMAKKGATIGDKAWIAAASDNSEFIISELSAITANMGLLNAGEIRLGSGVPGVGSGFTGIRIYKSGTTYRVEGVDSDVVQAKFDSDGVLKAGNSHVNIGINGINITTGNILVFTYGAHSCYLNETSGGILNIESVDGSINLVAPNYINLMAQVESQTILPETADDYYCGDLAQYWFGIAADYVFYKNLGTFDKYDDLAIIKSMKSDPSNPDIIDPASIHPSMYSSESPEHKTERINRIIKNKQDKLKSSYTDMLNSTGVSPSDKDKIRAKMITLDTDVETSITTRYSSKQEIPMLNLSNTNGLLFGAVKQLTLRLEALEAELTKQKESK